MAQVMAIRVAKLGNTIFLGKVASFRLNRRSQKAKTLSEKETSLLQQAEIGVEPAPSPRSDGKRSSFSCSLSPISDGPHELIQERSSSMSSLPLIRHQSTRSLPKGIKSDINKFQLEDYAKMFFQTRKRGVFKRSVPIKELLTFQKDMTAPLLDLRNKPDLNAIALRMFQLILTYQGLKKPLKPSEEIGTAKEILREALREGQIRDEIYCQLCKQTCETPSTDVLYKGWELMSVCCTIFPPTRNFEEWLRKYLWEHTKCTDTRQASFAMFCVRKLDFICQAPPSARMPSDYEIELIREAPFGFPQFGVSLQEIMIFQKQNGNLHLDVPQVLVVLCLGIARLSGHSALGIFRVKGDSKKMHEIKMEIECNKWKLETCKNPHDLASLLKVWLRELSEPLISSELQKRLHSVAHSTSETLEAINTIPPLNKMCLLYLFDFLRSFLESSVIEQTKMGLSNIASLFAPNLFRTPEHQVSVENSKLENNIVEILLLHWKE